MSCPVLFLDHLIWETREHITWLDTYVYVLAVDIPVYLLLCSDIVM